MILVAGIGNIFMGDDAFGSIVARRLLERPWPEHVRVVDFGIRGLALAYALLDPHDAVILIDAVPRGGEPGTIYVIEPELKRLNDMVPQIETHAMDPLRVIALAQAMGADLKRVVLVGCEPERVSLPEEGQMGLSPSVGHAVDEAVAVIESLIQEVLV